ncbi:hypothetical protein Leryth_020581 [Lithospermum erythrorhizon]|nr:hypothetical protein Leryth_020581 [Lithospermum erythrorhizon]
MDGNREEAIRVKVLAQNSMEKKDFLSALGLAVKAQQLYPGLENISTIIMVCEVICSGNKKVNDNEMIGGVISKVEATV